MSRIIRFAAAALALAAAPAAGGIQKDGTVPVDVTQTHVATQMRGITAPPASEPR